MYGARVHMKKQIKIIRSTISSTDVGVSILFFLFGLLEGSNPDSIFIVIGFCVYVMFRLIEVMYYVRT